MSFITDRDKLLLDSFADRDGRVCCGDSQKVNLMYLDCDSRNQQGQTLQFVVLQAAEEAAEMAEVLAEAA